MKLATIVIKLEKSGSNVRLERVTPAETMFLVADHHTNAGGDPIVSLEELEDESKLNASSEKLRLALKYGTKRINKFFPGRIPNLPSSFAEAREAGVSIEAPQERLLTVSNG